MTTNNQQISCPECASVFKCKESFKVHKSRNKMANGQFRCKLKSTTKKNEEELIQKFINTTDSNNIKNKMIFNETRLEKHELLESTHVVLRTDYKNV